jgi:Uma2 family endonuclease
MVIAPLDPPHQHDQRLIHTDLSWSQFKLIQAGFAEAKGVRLFYFNHTLEIIMPGRDHEFFKSIIGMLIELFCLECAIEFESLGSTTQENEEKAVAAEPDESYVFGVGRSTPDLVIEVVFTSGGPSKLARYAALNIAEVWFWQDGVLQVYHWQSSGDERCPASQIPELKNLDLDLLNRCILIAQTSRLEAARTFRNGLVRS